MSVATVSLHGPESTGKSTLAARLATHFGTAVVPEYGRAYCEAHGNDVSMAELVQIAGTQDRLAREAVAAADRGPVILDTDPLMTMVWADMMFGRRDPWFERWTGTADLYLVPDIDLPWTPDAVRMFGGDADRRRFLDLSIAALAERGARWAWVRGKCEARFQCALAAIEAAGLA